MRKNLQKSVIVFAYFFIVIGIQAQSFHANKGNIPFRIGDCEKVVLKEKKIYSKGFYKGTLQQSKIEEEPPFNIIAEITEIGTVNVTWQSPLTGVEGLLDPTLGTDYSCHFFSEPNENFHLGNLFKVEDTATVAAIEISSFGWDMAQVGELFLKFYNKDRVEIMQPVSFLLPDSTVEWFSIDVPDFTYVDDFYVMIHWNELPNQTAAIMYHNIEENVAYLINEEGEWLELTDLLGTDSSGAFSLRVTILKESNKREKVLTSYDLWRSNIIDISEESAWVKLNTEPISENGVEATFVDDTFNETIDGYYKYIVQAMYTEVKSEYSYSNDINKGIFVNATINIIANNGVDLSGYEVILTHTNGCAINIYREELVDGFVIFDRIIKGNYNLYINAGFSFETINFEIDIVSDTTTIVELIEKIIAPYSLNIYGGDEPRTVLFTWNSGREITYQVDDGTAEQSIGIKVGDNGELGNLFDVNESGQITSVDILAINDGEGGKVSIVVYDINHEIIGKTDEFIIETTDEPSFYNLPVNFIDYHGAFYIMIKYSSEESLKANSLAMDTDDNPGNAYYYNDSIGFVQLSNLDYRYGNFLIRANVLVNGKKSTVVLYSHKSSNHNTKVSEHIVITDIKPVVAKFEAKGVLSYNVFLDDMTTPVAEGITTQSFIFNESEHLTIEGSHNYIFGVQAVYSTGNSTVSSITFPYIVNVIDIVDSEIVICPNPTVSVIAITHTENSIIEIYSAAGKLVKTIAANNSESIINVSNLTNGLYIVRVKLDEGSIYRKLIIKR